jgi:hypothetical protein
MLRGEQVWTARIEGADGIRLVTDEVAKSVGSSGVDETIPDPFSCLDT